MQTKRKPKKQSNNTLLIVIMLLFGCLCLGGLGGGAAAYSMGIFDPPLPTLAPTLTKVAVAAKGSATVTITKASATSTSTKAAPTNTVPTATVSPPTATLVPTAVKPVLETIVKPEGQIEGVTLAQDKAGTLHVIYNVMIFDSTHKLVHHQKPIGGTWSGGVTVAQGDVFTPTLRVNPNGNVCVFWSGVGMSKSCFTNNAWSAPEKITDDLFPSSPAFAPDGNVHFLMSSNDTMYKGIDLDLPNTNAIEKFLTVDSSGRIHIVSQQLNSKKDIIHLFSDDKGGKWSSPTTIASGDDINALTADAQGRIHAVFSNSYRFWRRDKGWSEPTLLNLKLEAGATSIMIDAQGLAHILTRTSYLRQAADLKWSQPIQVATGDVLVNASTSPQLWLDASGIRHFVWVMSDNTVMYNLLP